MITYKWIFSQFKCKKVNEQFDNIVSVINWRYVGTNENGISADAYGSQEIDEPIPENFTPFNNLTESQVVSWMESFIDVSQMQNEIENQINLIENPTHIILPPPFSI